MYSFVQPQGLCREGGGLLDEFSAAWWDVPGLRFLVHTHPLRVATESPESALDVNMNQ